MKLRWLILALLVTSCAAQTVLGNKETDQQTLAVSGNTLTFPDTVGTQSNTFEVKVTGGPATLTVTVNGCMRGGTCQVLATSTSTSNSNLTTAGGPYDNYQLTGTWTGGSSPTLVVNRTGSSARKQSPATTQIVNASLAVGGDMAPAFAAACNALPSTGGTVDGRGVPGPIWLNSQLYCNKTSRIELPCTTIYTSVPIYMPGSGARPQLHGCGTFAQAGADTGTIIRACVQGGNDAIFANKNCGGNPFSFPLFGASGTLTPHLTPFESPLQTTSGVFPVTAVTAGSPATYTTTFTGINAAAFNGRQVNVYGCNNPNNNGVFTITAQTAAQFTATNSSAATEAETNCSVVVANSVATTGTFTPIVVAGSNAGLTGPLFTNCFGETITDLTIDGDFAPNAVGVYMSCAQELTEVVRASIIGVSVAAIYCEGCSHTKFDNLLPTCKPACFNPGPGGTKDSVGLVEVGGLTRNAGGTIATVTINGGDFGCSQVAVGAPATYICAMPGGAGGAYNGRIVTTQGFVNAGNNCNVSNPCNGGGSTQLTIGNGTATSFTATNSSAVNETSGGGSAHFTHAVNPTWIPWVNQTLNLVDANTADSSFLGVAQICGAGQGCTAPVHSGTGTVASPFLDTFSFLNPGTANQANVAAANVYWPQYGWVVEGGSPWSMNDYTITGSPPVDNPPQGTGLNLYNAIWLDNVSSGVLIGVHGEDVLSDMVAVGQYNLTSGMTLIGMNYGGTAAQLAGSAVVHFFPSAQGNSAYSTYTLFNNKNIIKDDHNQFVWAGATSACNGNNVEQCTASSYNQGKQGVPGCFIAGAGPQCGAAASGISQIAAAATTVTVSTTSVGTQSIPDVYVITANQGGLTCNAVTNPASLLPYVSAVVPSVSFTITSVAPTGGTACYGWSFNN